MMDEWCCCPIPAIAGIEEEKKLLWRPDAPNELAVPIASSFVDEVVRDFRALISPDPFGDYFRWNSEQDDEGRGLTFVTYGFPSGEDLPIVGSGPFDEFEVTAYYALNDAQQAHAREGFAQFDQASGLVLIEVDHDPMISVLHASDQLSVATGMRVDGNTPLFAAIGSPDAEMVPGSYYYQTLLHEVGHTLGLAHTHDGPFVLANDLDHNMNSVLSYQVYQQNGVFATELGPLDIAALQFLYGPDRDVEAAGLSYDFGPNGDRFNLIGSEEDDVVNGPNLPGRMEGRGGDDFLAGGAASVTISGGAGADTLSGAFGRTTLHGGEGDDVLLYGAASSGTLNGGLGHDLVTPIFDATYYRNLQIAGVAVTVNGVEEHRGTDQNDLFFDLASVPLVRGLGGDDEFHGGHTAVAYEGGTGEDLIIYSDADGIVLDLAAGYGTGGAANGDTYTGIEAVRADVGSDHIVGSAESERFYYLGGADTIDGGGGQDALDLVELGTSAYVDLSSGRLSVRVNEAWTDTGAIVTSIEEVAGGYARLMVFGSSAGEHFLGLSGEDVFAGGRGADHYEASISGYGAFGDIVSFAQDVEASQGAVVNLAAGTGRDGYGNVETFVNIDHLIGTDLADSFTSGLVNGFWGGDVFGHRFFGGAGDDTLVGGEVSDTLIGGVGNDVLVGGPGADVLYGEGTAVLSGLDIDGWPG